MIVFLLGFLLLTVAVLAYLFFSGAKQFLPPDEGPETGLLSKARLRAAFAMPLDAWQAHVAAQPAGAGAWRGTASALGDTLMERRDEGTVLAIRPLYERSKDRPDALVIVLVSRPKPEGVDGGVAAEAIRTTTNAMLPQFIVTGTHEERDDQITVEFMVTEDR